MSTLKFDVLELIREPDDYTSTERMQCSDAISNVIEQARKCVAGTGDLVDLRTALDLIGDVA